MSGSQHFPSTASEKTLGIKKSRQKFLESAGALLIKQTSSKQLVSTVFHEPWWLEIACDGNYREVTVSSGGGIVGRLPYQHASIYSLKVLNMPLMTYVLGPVFLNRGGNFPGTLKQIALTRDLIMQLPKASYVSFRLHGGVTNTLAFEAAGFSSTVDFTVEITPDSVDVLWRQMRDKTRNVIRRAEERLTTIDTLSPDGFLDFYEENLQRKRSINFYDRRICAKIISESRSRGVGRCLATVDSSNNLQSAIFTVWDHCSEYYLMSTRAPDSINGAVSLAIWAAIQHAASRGRTFDMSGIHVHPGRLPNIMLLTGFGGEIKPRYRVKRATSSAIEIAVRLKAFLA